MFRKLYTPAAIFITVLAIGTTGYYFIGGEKYSLLDCLYMTVITVFTIGFTEVIDLSNNDAGRVFTIFIAFTGVGTATYMISQFTALIVEGEIKETFKKRKMEKELKKLENHFIVCGAGRVGSIIIRELYSTKRNFVVIEKDEQRVEELNAKYPNVIFILGDADIEEVLERAGIQNAEGLFAATGDDNQNLVTCLTAKSLNSKVRVVSRCLEFSNQHKMFKAGADSVISENFIAGMRMASEMIRPTVVSFLDKMLSDKDKNLRVEEILLNEKHSGKKILELGLEKFPNTLLVAVASGHKWSYNPKNELEVERGSRLIVITSPDERLKLTEHLG